MSIANLLKGLLIAAIGGAGSVASTTQISGDSDYGTILGSALSGAVVGIAGWFLKSPFKSPKV